MKKCQFLKASFCGSFVTSFPELRSRHGAILPEIAIVGRSNVGKSSLINHLLCNKQLAKVSSFPGKTQTINLFNVDDQLILADLPGYGFAKRAKTIQQSWVHSIGNYLKSRDSLQLLLLLIDARRGAEKEEIALVEWANHYKKPILLVFTKSDTLPSREMQRNIHQTLADLKQQSALHYSIRDAKSRKILAEFINERIYGTYQ